MRLTSNKNSHRFVGRAAFRVSIGVLPLRNDNTNLKFDSHVVAGGLQCRRHHGKTRLTDLRDLDGVNVVLTTYHTVSAEWKDGKEAENSALFGVCWRRIILDEGGFSCPE